MKKNSLNIETNDSIFSPLSFHLYFRAIARLISVAATIRYFAGRVYRYTRANCDPTRIVTVAESDAGRAIWILYVPLLP